MSWLQPRQHFFLTTRTDIIKKRTLSISSFAVIITPQVSRISASTTLLFNLNTDTSNMFNTPKRTNDEATSSYSIMCPPPPTRSTCRASPDSHLSEPSLLLDSFFKDLNLSESRSPMKVDGFFLKPLSAPSIPNLSENHHQGGSIRLQPRSRVLSDAGRHQIRSIKLKPRPSHRRTELVQH